jgi:acyl transferase domain-containing protein
VRVHGAGETGRRQVTIHSRPHEPGLLADELWTCHASGTLSPDAEPVSMAWGRLVWPPVNAEPVDLAGAYASLAEHGYEYGPAFQGLRAAWRLGDDVYAEVALPEPEREAARRFGIHPALLDAALHPIVLGLTEAGLDGPSVAPRLPFSWSGVRRYAEGATELRVRVAPAGGGHVELQLADGVGFPVASVDSLTLRPWQPGSPRQAHPEQLFGVDWIAVPGGAEGGQPPPDGTAIAGDLDDSLGLRDALRRRGTEPLVFPSVDDLLKDRREESGLPELVFAVVAGGDASDVVAAAHERAQSVLDLVRRWLAEPRCGRSRLVVVTSGAVAALAGDDVRDLPGSTVWGLLRTAQTEQPDRFVLLDTDGSRADAALTALSPAAAPAETQLVLRAGTAYMPRLGKIREATAEDGACLDADGTVLVTGGTGTLGGIVARHLVARHGARHLLLVSRQGSQATQADELRSELAAGGAEVTLASCDVADREALAALLAGISPAHPLTAVVHTAGVIDDGTVESLRPEQLSGVFRPKVDAAWYLHELTADLDLTAFVLFSSVVATVGNAGQANYAAANTFQDALAAYRRVRRQLATSIGWGLWAQGSGMTSHLNQADVARMSRSGVAELPTERALDLFDQSIATDRAHVIAAGLDLPALRGQAQAQVLPPIFRGLVRQVARRSAATGGEFTSLADRLSRLRESERDQVLLDVVRAQVATVLGHATRETIDARRSFKDLGFESLTGVELRNQLAALTGLRLPSSLIFDYPSTAALVAYLRGELSGQDKAPERTAAPSTAAMDEPIAIVGMSCRYPGGVTSPDELWQLVTDGRDAIAGFPEDRCDRQELRTSRRLPVRRRGLRRRLLRDQPARGAGHRPAAPVAA